MAILVRAQRLGRLVAVGLMLVVVHACSGARGGEVGLLAEKQGPRTAGDGARKSEGVGAARAVDLTIPQPPNPSETVQVVTPAPNPVPLPQPQAGSAAVPAPRDWPTIGGGLEQSFARTDAPFDAASIGDLRVRWSVSSPGGVTGTPAVRDAIAYWGDWAQGAHATSIIDGSELWSTEIEGGVAASPFVTADRVYVASRRAQVVALERSRGLVQWSRTISDSEIAHLWSSPVVVDRVLIVGVATRGGSVVNAGAPVTMPFRGAVVALDSETGDVRWRFETTVADGTRFGPGGSCWSSAAIDSTRKLAFIGTGNSFSAPASPYTDALLALDYTTDDPAGRLFWARQFTENDNFTPLSPMGPGFDVGATPNLFTLDGTDYVGVGDKGGTFHVMKRDDGEPIWDARVSAGSSIGGIVGAAGYADGVLYVTANVSGTKMVLSALDARSGRQEWSVELNEGVSFGSPLVLSDFVLVSPTQPFPTRPAIGALQAFLRSDGSKLDWVAEIPSQHAGGISLYDDMIFVPAGFTNETSGVERSMPGHLVALSR